MRLGLFGGTFDPPHLGHLILAEEARAQLGLERVLWILTADPPHKRGLNLRPWVVRLALLEAAIANNPAFEVSRVEIDRPGPHYAVDTLRLLRKAYPQDELVYLIGGDSLHDLPLWYQPQEMISLCDILGVMRRPDDRVNIDEIETHLPGIRQRVQFVQAPLVEISSHDIRSRIANGRPYRYFLPEPVTALIDQMGLYL